MTYFITGATGHYGSAVVRELIALGTPADQIIAAGRNADKLAALKNELGVNTAQVDNDDPAALDKALEGVDKVLLVSGVDFAKRAQQHRNVIDAAKKNGVKLLAYTSVLKADTSPLLVAVDHRATEAYLETAGVPYVSLRNTWYAENFIDEVKQAGASGVLETAAGDGAIAAASRADLAAAGAKVLFDGTLVNATLELGSDATFTYADLARIAGEIYGKEVAYKPVSVEQRGEDLKAAGVPQGGIDWVTKLDGDIAAGALAGPTGGLSAVIGRAPQTIEDVLKGALKA